MKGINKKYLQDYLDESSFRRIFANSPITLVGEMLFAIGKYWKDVGSLDDLDYTDLLYDSDDELIESDDAHLNRNGNENQNANANANIN